MSTSHPFVIKYGGSLLEDEKHQLAFLKQVADLAKREHVILVHGGGKEITRALESSGIPTRFVGGRRFTDDATMAVVEKTLAEINSRIVAALKKAGAKPKGYSGKFRELMVGRRMKELGRVGQPAFVDGGVLEAILEKSRLPVFYTVASDSDGGSLNINADDFALALAVTSHARRLIFLTDTGGILDKEGRQISFITERDVDELIEDQTITGGMAVKAQACVEAIRQGVGRVDISKGIDALLDPEQSVDGTSFVQDDAKLN
jgi:acetylglutamate kinase